MPGFVKSIESLNANCQKDSNIIFLKRRCTYILKTWEDELNIKGATISNIAKEFLRNQIEPKHIDEITHYVNMYRDATSENIYFILKISENKSFLFFRGKYVGLSYKDYSSNSFMQKFHLSGTIN